jgi:hypothetical protein
LLVSSGFIPLSSGLNPSGNFVVTELYLASDNLALFKVARLKSAPVKSALDKSFPVKLGV